MPFMRLTPPVRKRQLRDDAVVLTFQLHGLQNLLGGMHD